MKVVALARGWNVTGVAFARQRTGSQGTRSPPPALRHRNRNPLDRVSRQTTLMVLLSGGKQGRHRGPESRVDQHPTPACSRSHSAHRRCSGTIPACAAVDELNRMEAGEPQPAEFLPHMRRQQPDHGGPDALTAALWEQRCAMGRSAQRSTSADRTADMFKSKS